MEKSAQLFVALVFSIMAVSHLVQRRVWVDYFIWLRSLGHVGVFSFGIITLSFGCWIVAFHNVWTGLPIIVTLLGWSQVLKGAVYMILPEVGLRGFQRISPERLWMFSVGGVGMVVLCAI